MKQDFDCVVVANGLFPLREEVLTYLRVTPQLIACDGAAKTLLDKGFAPTAIVGDLDSLPEEIRYNSACEVRHSAEQMTNDLTKAVHFAHEKGYERLLILGATGLREDHTLGNISLLTEYIDLFDSVEMMSDFGVFIPMNRSRSFRSEPGQQISIFCITPQTRLTTTGLRWEVTNRRFECWWQGTLNEAIGHEFTISVDEPARLVIYKSIVDFKSPYHQKV